MVRHAAHLLLKSLLPGLNVAQLAPFSKLLFSAVACGLTHINPAIQLDTLKNASLFLVHCPLLVRQNAASLLPLYLPLISRATASSSKGKTAQLSVAPQSIFSMRSSLVEVFKQLLEFLSIVTATNENDNFRPSIVIDPCKEQAWTSAGDLPLTEPVDLLEYLSTSTLLLHLSAKHALPSLLGRGVASEGCPLPIGREQFVPFVEQIVPVLLEFWLEIVPTVAMRPTRKVARIKRKGDDVCMKLQLVLDLLWLVLRFSLRHSCSSEVEHSWAISQNQLSSMEKHLLAYFPIELNPSFRESSSLALQLNLRLCQLMLLAHASHSGMVNSSTSYDSGHLDVVIKYLIPQLSKSVSAFASSALFADFVGSLVSSLDAVLLSPLSSQVPERILLSLLSAVAHLFSACHPLSTAKHRLLMFVDELLMRTIASPGTVR